MSDRPNSRQVSAHVGRRLRRRRSDLGLSLEEVAMAAGMTSRQASRYESGAAVISAPRLRVLASMFGVSPAYFYRGLQPTMPLGQAGLSLNAGS